MESESRLPNLDAWQLRPVRPADKDAIIALIDTIFREYGDRVFLEGADADLLDLAAHYEPGLFMVLAAGNDVGGTVALQHKGDDRSVASLRRMYLHEDLRGTGAGARMLEWALTKAAALGARQVDLWTDARFERAHRFYKKFGFTDSGEVRLMHDGAMPYEEFRFYLDL